MRGGSMRSGMGQIENKKNCYAGQSELKILRIKLNPQRSIAIPRSFSFLSSLQPHSYFQICTGEEQDISL